MLVLVHSSLSVVQQNLQLSLKNLQDSLSSMDLQNQSSELAGLLVLVHSLLSVVGLRSLLLHQNLLDSSQFRAKHKHHSPAPRLVLVQHSSLEIPKTEQPESTQAKVNFQRSVVEQKLLDSIQQKKPFFTNLAELPNQLSELAGSMLLDPQVSVVSQNQSSLSVSLDLVILLHSVVVLNPEQLMLRTPLCLRHAAAQQNPSVRVTTMLKETQQFLVKQQTLRLLLATMSSVMLDALVVRQLRSRLMIISDLVHSSPSTVERLQELEIMMKLESVNREKLFPQICLELVAITQVALHELLNLEQSEFPCRARQFLSSNSSVQLESIVR